ncbi:MAG: four helix bundle protein [Runella sp.]
MQNYRELIVWQKAHYLTLEIFKIIRQYPKDEQYILISQIKRASLSVVLNIVERCGKFKPLDTANFFQIALGSAQEVEYCLFLSKELSYLNIEEYENLSQHIGEVKAMLISLIKKIRSNP